MSYKLLTTHNQKIEKGEKEGYITAGLHFAAANASGHNVCPMASAGCRLACLTFAGHGRYQRTQNARIKKTKRFFEERDIFMSELIKDIETFVRRAKKNNMIPALRLNLTSDVVWETIKYQGKTLFELFPDVSFYDYTKIAKRMLKGSEARKYKNYHLTFSRSESNSALCEIVMQSGGNVAMVFADKLPAKYQGRKVVNGDINDLRFLDKKGVIVGLSMKGRAKHDETGFVIRAA